jgi:hypothetical protein
MLGIGCRGRHALPLTPAENARTVTHPPRAGSFFGRTPLVILAPPNGSLLALCDDVLAEGHIPDSEVSGSRRADAEWRECAKAALGYDSLSVKLSKLVMDEGAAGRFRSIKRATPDTLKQNAFAFNRIGSPDFWRGAHTTRRKRKIRCTTRISSPIMTICIDDAAAMVGSPCH